MILQKHELPELDYQFLDKELDRTKTRVFLGNNAAFLGPLMCGINFMWSKDIPTAATNGAWIKWNPYYFHFLGLKQRNSILVHELWHVGLLHPLRRGDRDPVIWNHAIDTVLDNMMDLDGYCVDETLFPPELFPPSKSFVNHALYGTMAAEEIYDLMIKNAIKLPTNPRAGDVHEPDKNQAQAIINSVVAATHQAKMSGAGNMPGQVEAILKKFLSPKLPWEQLLYQFFNELGGQDYSWARPNRRYNHVYLPSLMEDRDQLEHVIYYQDVSGSISDGDSIRFNSEFKYVKETFQPEKMTFVQFDTVIQSEDVFEKDDPFDEIKIKGRGGTCLACVREHILKHKPTAVVIFSDMQVTPMEPLPLSDMVPIIWVALNSGDVKIPHGQLIHLRE